MVQVDRRNYSTDIPSSGNHEDLALAEEVMRGSVPAWHEYVEKYSRLIYSVLRRHFYNDDDEIHSLFADVLARLYHGKLSEYDGRASMSTWLVLITQGRALDHVRRKRGRRRLPEGFKRLNKFEQRVFQMRFLEAMDIDSIVTTINWKSDAITTDDVSAAITTIDATVDNRYLRRVTWDRAARAQGFDRGRQLEYLEHARDQYRAAQEQSSPDYEMAQREHGQLLGRLRSLVGVMNPREREIVNMRFEQGLTAAEISKQLGLGGQRTVYTLLDRIFRQLRADMREKWGARPTNP